jgi:hypothetical protein
LVFARRDGKTGRVCAALLAVVFLTLTVFMASLPPDRFFAGLSSQNRVDSIIRALEIIDGTSLVEDSCALVLRSMVARAWTGAGHCADVSFISSAGSHTDRREPANDPDAPPVSRAGGVDTVARE